MFILTIFHYTVSLKYIHIVLWLLPPNISRTFPFSQIETLYPSTHPYPTPGNYHSKFFLNELDYLRYVIWVEPYSICHFVTCLFQLTSSSFLHVIARVRISSLRCDSIPLYVENTFFFFFLRTHFPYLLMDTWVASPFRLLWTIYTLMIHFLFHILLLLASSFSYN